MPEDGVFFAHQPDHVIATQHRGLTELANLALACVQCNRFEGPNIASLDPETNHIVPLFNPRTDSWLTHFRAESGRIIPLTPTARATAALLNFNDPDRQEARRKLAQVGRYP
jgi:5-methylcytosine-specific restriction endonuclease McrA